MRPIDADALKNDLYKVIHRHYNKRIVLALFLMLDIISVRDTINAVPVRHGKWENVPGMNSKCSECGHYFPVKDLEYRPFDINYCPNCGAKMDGGTEK